MGTPGCLHHLTHPCEGCGRIGGRMKYRVRIDLQGINEDDYDNLLDEIDTVRRKYGGDND